MAVTYDWRSGFHTCTFCRKSVPEPHVLPHIYAGMQILIGVLEIQAAWWRRGLSSLVGTSFSFPSFGPLVRCHFFIISTHLCVIIITVSDHANVIVTSINGVEDIPSSCIVTRRSAPAEYIHLDIWELVKKTAYLYIITCQDAASILGCPGRTIQLILFVTQMSCI